MSSALPSFALGCQAIPTWVISRILASAAKLRGECPPATHRHLLCSLSLDVLGFGPWTLGHDLPVVLCNPKHFEGHAGRFFHVFNICWLASSAMPNIIDGAARSPALRMTAQGELAGSGRICPPVNPVERTGTGCRS